MLAGGQLLHKLENHHSDMIDTMYYLRQNNWLISIGRDQNLIIWKLINHHIIQMITSTPE
jgi:ferric iron reductase protein FhuF